MQKTIFLNKKQSYSKQFAWKDCQSNGRTILSAIKMKHVILHNVIIL